MMEFQKQEYDHPRTSEEILATHDPDGEELRREIVGHDDDGDETEGSDEPSTRDKQKAVALVRRLHVNLS